MEIRKLKGKETILSCAKQSQAFGFMQIGYKGWIIKILNHSKNSFVTISKCNLECVCIELCSMHLFLWQQAGWVVAHIGITTMPRSRNRDHKISSTVIAFPST